MLTEPTSLPPLVTVVVTTFNRQALLRETVGAILVQTFQDFELLLIDNQSSDGTGDYANTLKDGRVRYVQNANHGLVAVNRNVGLKMARGRYIAYCDDDDVWLPGKLAAQVALMERHPEFALCGCGMTLRRGGVDAGCLHLGGEGIVGLRRLLWRNVIGTSCALIRTDVIREFGGFDETGKFSPYEDYELWLRIAARRKVFLLHENLVVYRVHGGNASPSRARAIALVLKVLKSMRYTIGAHGAWYWLCVGLRTMQYWTIYLRGRLGS